MKQKAGLENTHLYTTEHIWIIQVPFYFLDSFRIRCGFLVNISVYLQRITNGR